MTLKINTSVGVKANFLGSGGGSKHFKSKKWFKAF
jgi:hypothetical protein